MLGMAGVLFSSQLEDTVLQTIVVLLCLAIPLFIGGNLLARVYSDGLQRFLLMGGMAMLTIGAMATVSGLSDSLVDSEYVSKEIGDLSRYLGMGSLLIGLLVVLYTIVRSEALIDELGDRFSHVADHMGEGFVLLDGGGRVFLVNKQLESMTGISGEEILGKSVQELADEYSIGPVVRHGERRARGLASEYELDWERDDHTSRLLIHESPLFDKRKRRAGTLMTVHDVSVEHRLKKRLEQYTQGLQRLVENRTEKLYASETRLRELLVNMDEGFLTVDRGVMVGFANERILRLLRSDKHAFVGRDLFDFVHVDDRERLKAALARVGSGSPQREDRDYTFVRSDGAYVQVKVSIAPIRDEAEDVMSLSMVVTDVQELKEVQHELEVRARELELANEQLRELDRAKDVFLSNVSHELRTPLGTLDGYIEMLLSEDLGKITGPQKAGLDVMSRNVERLSLMINEMIESSRMEIQGIRLFRTLFTPERLLRECAESVHPLAMKKDIGVTVHSSEDVVFMWGDREKAGQSVCILLSNALKFAPEGSSVIVTTDRRKNGDVAVVVSDAGIGIRAEYQEKIFSKFYQVDSSLTRHYQGTGIGLSIAKSIMEAHGGRIELESRPEKGSTFTLLFPGALFAADDYPPVEPESLDRAVYVAIPYPEYTTALLETLSTAGYEVTGFASGHECVRWARESPPNLIIMHEAMLDLSPAEAKKRLEEREDTSRVPVLVLPSLSERNGTSESAEDETSDDFAGAFTAEQLLDRVRVLVRLSKLGKPAAKRV